MIKSIFIHGSTVPRFMFHVHRLLMVDLIANNKYEDGISETVSSLYGLLPKNIQLFGYLPTVPNIRCFCWHFEPLLDFHGSKRTCAFLWGSRLLWAQDPNLFIIHWGCVIIYQLQLKLKSTIFKFKNIDIDWKKFTSKKSNCIWGINISNPTF